MKTGKKAWTGQRKKDIDRKGKSKAPWIVFWKEPDGRQREKSCGAGKEGRRLAMKEVERLHSELLTGTYEQQKAGVWHDFKVKYKEEILSRKSDRHEETTLLALGHFERIVQPRRMQDITSQQIDSFVSKRLKEPGQKKGDTVSPATVNKELRCLRMALRKAYRWGYLPTVPHIEFEREPEKIPRFMTPEHFADIYAQCDSATLPKIANYSAGDFWRAVLVTAYMTGWRIGEILTLRRADVDLSTGFAKLRASNTKGRREEVLRLHPVVIEHITAIRGFHELVFQFPHDKRQLYAQFHRIQQAAGIHLPCDGDHEHTPTCHLYGFHDERRAFATVNHGQVSDDELQQLMRHRDRKTTMLYKNMVRHTQDAADRLFVPDVLRTGTHD